MKKAAPGATNTKGGKEDGTNDTARSVLYFIRFIGGIQEWKLYNAPR